jgi:hypothetical protein
MPEPVSLRTHVPAQRPVSAMRRQTLDEARLAIAPAGS